MHNDFFENYYDHIQLLSKRSTKDQSKIFIRLQKGKLYSLSTFNGFIEQEYIKSFEGINLHKFTKNGYILFASSDRMHLQDVSIRLYQELDNIIKSYKGHKVHSFPVKIELPENKVEDANLEETVDFDTNYLHNTILHIYESLDSTVVDNYFLHLNLESISSVWQISYENIIHQFTEFSCYIIYTLENKQTGKIVKNFIQLKPDEIKNRNINVNSIRQEINQLITFTDSLNIQQEDEKINIQPSLIILDQNLTKEIIIKLYQQDLHSTLFNISKYSDSLPDNEEYLEHYDKLCNQKLISVNSDTTLRQMLFNQKPQFLHRCLIFEENVKIDLTEHNVENLARQLSEHFQLKNILFLCGSNYDSYYLNTVTHDNIVLNPIYGIYTKNGKNLTYVDIEYIEIPNIDHLKLIQGEKYHLVPLPVYNTYIGVYGFSYSFILNPENIVLV